MFDFSNLEDLLHGCRNYLLLLDFETILLISVALFSIS